MKLSCSCAPTTKIAQIPERLTQTYLQQVERKQSFSASSGFLRDC